MESAAEKPEPFNPEHFEPYFNRELSMLAFNRRVLAMARDPDVPLLERLRFLCIFSANLDEFFEIRVAGLKQLIALGATQTVSENFSPRVILKEITTTTRTLVEEQYRILNEELLPALAKTKIHFVPPKKWNLAQTNWAKKYFINEVLPLVSPVALDPAHPMPRLVNKSLNFIVTLQGKDAFGRETHLAIVHAPRSLARVIPVPQEIIKTCNHFVFLTSLIEFFADELFPGMTVTGCYQFRLTRNSDLLTDDEDVAEDLAGFLKNKLLLRPYGNAVRLEIAADCPQDISEFLLQKHALNQEEVYCVHGPVNLSRLIKLYDLIDAPTLKYPPFKAGLPFKPKQIRDLFTTIRTGDRLLHHPFQSFNPILEFIRQATLDSNVLAIKQTLYRTGPDSPIVHHLAEAARAGKEVTAVIELRARFEEESNLELANRLQEAGVLVVYGVMNFKTHCKMILVVRRENGALRRYCHLGTGNYHATTTRSYTDYGFFTADEAIGLDVQSVFQQLTGMSKPLRLKKLFQSPFSLAKKFLELIEQEITHARAGNPARIIAKMNALTDTKMIDALYTASQAGVKIDLIVRGICCLRPGVAGISTNIQVRSVVGRFLEHERVYYFHNNGDEKIYCSSADWMERNLYKRIEVCFPLEDKSLAERVKKESLLNYLADNYQSWQLQADGNWQRRIPQRQKLHVAQQLLLEKLGEIITEPHE